MENSCFFVKALICILFLGAAVAGPAGAAEEELQALIEECESCHGPAGVSTDSDVPIIAGQSEPLIEKAHEHFKDWARPCRRTAFRHGDTSRPPTTMCDVSAGLDGIEIEAIATHFAAQAFVPAAQPFDEAKAIAGAPLHEMYCASCHPDGGSASGFAGRLAGQWTPYLAGAIEQIKRSEVIVPHIMERKLADFSAEEIDALLNFWASQQE